MADGPWTSKRLLAWTTQAFEQRGIESPRIAAEMLLAHVLGVQRLKLYMDPDRPANDLERAAFRDLVERALADEPVDYLVGQAPFFSMMFKVSPAVLVPRPSTETLVEHVLQHCRRTPGFESPTVADVCTGSGAVAVSLARQLKRDKTVTGPGSILATDLYEDALAVARENAQAHGVSELVDFRHGDLLEPLGKETFSYLVSNPPYIPDDEWAQVAPNVKDHEPTHALRGGEDGLDLIRPLIAGALAHLRDPGQLVVEIASVQKDEVIALAEQAGLRNATVLVDHEHLPRVLVADTP